MNQKRKLSGMFFFVLTFLIGLGSVSAQQTATATASIFNGFVVGIAVTSGGSGYGFAPPVTISGGGGAGAGAFATISGGVVTAMIEPKVYNGATSQRPPVGNS
jgi:hypothetical protein